MGGSSIDFPGKLNYAMSCHEYRWKFRTRAVHSWLEEGSGWQKGKIKLHHHGIGLRFKLSLSFNHHLIIPYF